MSWRDAFQQGSFRGVPFHIRRASTQVGRRGQLHEYPLRDRPWAEDLGRRARQFVIECLVIGRDYMAARDALIKALETKGPGTLVHPYYGVRRVSVVDAVHITEDTREGGLAHFRIPFAESGEKLEPAASTDTAAKVASQATATANQAAQSFGDSFSVSGMPQWVSDAATGDLGNLTDRLGALRDSIPGIPTAVTAFNQQLQAFSDGVSSLIRTPYDLGASVVSLVLGLGTMARQPFNALGLYKGLLDFGSGDASVPTSTPARQQEADNRTALHQLVRVAAVTQLAASVASVPAQTQPVAPTVAAADPTATPTQGFDTVDAATATRDTITASIDDQVLTADDTLYGQLVDLAATVVRDVDARAAGLPALTTFTPGRTVPALVVAYRLYDDATRDSEIVARNDPAYPAFLTGGQPLEVLGV